MKQKIHQIPYVVKRKVWWKVSKLIIIIFRSVEDDKIKIQ